MILSGENSGWYVKIISDKTHIGGFYILISQSIDFSDGFDNWVNTDEDLNSFFIESQWVINWL